MRWLARTLIVVLLVTFLAAPAQAGPLRDIIQSLPTSGEVPNPDDLPTDDLPTDGTDPLALAMHLKNELDTLVEDTAEDAHGAAEAVTAYVVEWAMQAKDNGECIEPDVVANGGTPLVPPEVESGHNDGHQWVAVHTGAVSVILYTKEDCLGAPQSQSYPGP